MRTRIGYIVLTIEFQREGRRWTAYCHELGTATFGRSLTQAEEKIREAIVLHLNTLEDVGESERFFAEHNITLHRDKPREQVTIERPISTDTYVHPYIQRLPEVAGVA